MLITREHQEALVEIYKKDHNHDETIGFIDGMGKMMELFIKLSNPIT